jgi:type IV secretion system protein VirB5
MANTIRFQRGALLLSWCVAGFAVWGAVRMAGQSKVVPYIVERDRLGQVVQFGQLSAASEPDRATMVSELARFIVAMRTIYTDPIAQLDMINRGYFYTQGRGRAFVDAYFSDPKRNPRVLSKDVIRQVDVTSVLPPVGGSDSWTLKWRETEIPVRGGAPTISSWEAAARVVVVPPDRAETIQRNPLGIYISDLTWTRVSEPAKVRVEDVRRELEQDRELRERGAARELGIDPSAATNR